MSSRIRVALATCLALSMAIPIPGPDAAAHAESGATAHNGVAVHPAPDPERAARGHAKGRKSEPFGERSGPRGSLKVPSKVHPGEVPAGDAPDRAVVTPQAALPDGPIDVFFLDGATAGFGGTGAGSGSSSRLIGAAAAFDGGGAAGRAGGGGLIAIGSAS